MSNPTEGFVPCPFCKQYSHSIGDDRLAKAFMHFQTMYAHPMRGTPMGHIFDEQTRDAAQVLMARARAASGTPLREDPERGLRAKPGGPTLEEGDAQTLSTSAVRKGR